MKLALGAVSEEDLGLISACGIICLGCDMYRDEGLEAAKVLVRIWEGFNLPDIAEALHLDPEHVSAAISTIKRFIRIRGRTGPCPGCFKGGGPSKTCSIARCVKEKGYWTCAECHEYNPDSIDPCPHFESATDQAASRGTMSALIRRRYSSSTTESLKRCREIGYAAFIAEIKESVRNGWRTWQVISNEIVFGCH
jgi:hypothetical protein